LPAAIHFVDDREGAPNQGYMPWPLFWSAYHWTGDRKYLGPIEAGGPSLLMRVNANLIDLLDLRRDWTARLAAGGDSSRALVQAMADPRRPKNPLASQIGFGDKGLSVEPEQIEWQLTGDKRYLETLYERQLREIALGEYIQTEGSLWIDRVTVPNAELQRDRLGGIALTRTNTFPGQVVSWRFDAPASDESVALLVPSATAREFKVVAYNLESFPVHTRMTGWNIDPGLWEIAQGIALTGNDTADTALTTRFAPLARSGSIELILPPRATSVITFVLRQPGTPYWQRPDLGLDPEDISVHGREVIVRIHSLGAVASPASTVVFRDRAGRIVATDRIPPLAAPDDLRPKTIEIRMTLPDGVTASGGAVEIDPEHQLEEITRQNNRAAVPAEASL